MTIVSDVEVNKPEPEMPSAPEGYRWVLDYQKRVLKLCTSTGWPYRERSCEYIPQGWWDSCWSSPTRETVVDAALAILADLKREADLEDFISAGNKQPVQDYKDQQWPTS